MAVAMKNNRISAVSWHWARALAVLNRVGTDLFKEFLEVLVLYLVEVNIKAFVGIPAYVADMAEVLREPDVLLLDAPPQSLLVLFLGGSRGPGGSTAVMFMGHCTTTPHCVLCCSVLCQVRHGPRRHRVTQRRSRPPLYQGTAQIINLSHEFPFFLHSSFLTFLLKKC